MDFVDESATKTNETHKVEDTNSSEQQIPHITSPSIDLRKRVLALSQKGDWVACEITLRMLEKEAEKEGDAKPLTNVTDEVSYWNECNEWKYYI